MKPFFLCLAVVLTACGQKPAEAPGKTATPTPAKAASAPVALSAADSQADFDYYVMSASWSPEHCASPQGARDRMQCAGPRKFDFVLHGLWPQHEKGYPADCQGERVSDALIDRMLDVMPSKGLIIHEWRKHGTCSGLRPVEYFAKARAAFLALRTPQTMQLPNRARKVGAKQLEQEILSVNPQLTASSVVVRCDGKFLQEIRVCYTKDLKPRACSQEVERGECRLPDMIVQEVK